MSRHNPARISMTIMGQRSQALEMARGRLGLIAAFFVLLYVVLSVRLFDLTILQGVLSREAQPNSATEMPLPTPKPDRRADIVDRNGQLLATSVKSSSLFADPKLMVDAPHAAKELARIFPNMNVQDLQNKFSSKTRYVMLQRNLSPAQQEAVMRIGEPGLAFQSEYRRVYPQGRLVAHAVGLATVDGHGLSGMERGMDRQLLASDEPVALSVDVRIQHVLHRELEFAKNRFQGVAAAGMVMDPHTGEVLAAVSLPDFDPHNPDRPTEPTMFNRTTLGVYELGSVFKIFSTAALIDGGTPMSQTFDATQPLKRGRFTISDYHGEKRVLTVPEVFMVSSNIGTALMAEKIGSDRMQSFYRDLGLLDAAKSEIIETGKPLFPRPWRDMTTLTASYGHGIAVTPLQMTSAVSSIVNGGFKVQPTFLKKDEDKQQTKVRVISAQTSANMRQLMRLVVSNGTGKNADVVGYRVGGKTGTAEKNSATGGYDRKRLISSFVGAFPVDDPKYVVFIMVDEPKPAADTYGYATAGWVAAPAVGRVAASLGGLVGMVPDKNAPEIQAPLMQYVSAKKKH